MPHIIKLSKDNFKRMPWKNGNGFTTQLAIEPAHASITGGFDWRISMADVKDSGPFSCLIGVDRTILILKGGGMELDHGTHGKDLLRTTLNPIKFQGEWGTFGRLLCGPCLDFNVMTERERAHHILSVMRPELMPIFLPKAHTVLTYCVDGNAYVTSTKEAITSGELLRIDFQRSSSEVELRTTDKSTVLIVVAITLVTAGEI
jgi:hypothetical protein